MIYHIVVGDEAARPLREAVATEPSMAGEVVVMHDILHVGPLQRGEGQSFSALRTEWWNEVVPDAKPVSEVRDLERLLEISNELYKDTDAVAWCWMAPWPADICAYYWMLPYLGKHAGRFHVVNLANLPFLNEAGKVFYPRNVSELLPKELIKARKLARPVTPSEIELDGDTWQSLVEAGAGLRTHEGGKKLRSVDESFYDANLLGLLTADMQKAGRVIGTACSKGGVPTGDYFLAWRMRRMAEEGRIELRTEGAKSFKDWECRLQSSATQTPAG